jgi:hypothetical protein
VVITIGGHTWRSRVASMGGRFIVGISAANRAASGITEGDVVEVDLLVYGEHRLVLDYPESRSAQADPRSPDKPPDGLPSLRIDQAGR